MATKLEKLMFSISLLDRVSGPANKIVRELDRIQHHAQKGTAAIAAGAIGITAAMFSLQRGLQPALDMNRALATVASLDVTPKGLQTLNKMALVFAARWGVAADQVVASAYDIQSAIPGLNDLELAGFTRASNILAKATTADANTITSFVGTMFGIFQNEANRMGRQQWIEQLVGQTAVAVQMFKTTGSEMSGAFVSLGADATSMGVGMAEQIAILGQLQATMSGSEAGTKFKAFLAGAGRAQKELGLSFVDSQGKILPMIEILDRIQGKFGQIDTLAESDLLKKAFGTKEAVSLIKLLMQNTDGLADNIDAIGKQTGLSKAAAMATTMIDPLDRMIQGAKSVQIVFGQLLLKSLEPLMNSISGGSESLLRWIGLFPNITKLVSVVVLSILGLVATVSLLTIAIGIGRFFMIGWGLAMKLLTPVVWLFKGALVAARGAWFLFQIALFLGSKALGAARLAMLAFTPAVWGFTAALLANPITWIVVGIVALIAAVVAATVYWDRLTAVFSNIDWAALLQSSLGILQSGLDWLSLSFSGLGALWSSLTDGFADSLWLQAALVPFKLLGDALSWLGSKLAEVGAGWAGFMASFATISPFKLLGDAADWIIDKLNLIPGINIETRFTPAEIPETAIPEAALSPKESQVPVTTELPTPAQLSNVIQLPQPAELPKTAALPEQLEQPKIATQLPKHAEIPEAAAVPGPTPLQNSIQLPQPAGLPVETVTKQDRATAIATRPTPNLVLVKAPDMPEKPQLQTTATAAVPAGGGAINRITNATNNSNRSLNIGQMNVSSGGTVDGAMLANELEMAAA